MGSQQKKKKRTKDVRSTTSEIKRTQDLDANKLALQPTFEIGYSPQGVGTIDFVSVTESINASQTNAPTPPSQVTGLNVTVGGDNQLNLTWTASGSIGVISYNIYRSLSSGAETLINSSSTNSFSDITVIAGTTYYYKVAAVNSYGMVGTLSAEDSATTSGTTPPMLELSFENNYTDTSPNNFPVYGLTGTPVNGFTPSGQFGSAWQCNTPITPSTRDGIYLQTTPELQMNTSIGFSFSCWVYPVDLTAAVGFRRFIVEHKDDANNNWSISIDSAGILYFFVTKAGTTYKRQISGFTLNSWQHIGAVFNGATNTVELYRNGVAGASSTAAEVSTITNSNVWVIGARWDDINSTYYEGRLDELRYYQKVLTSTQINNLKNTNAP
jgi:hypothetical protein